MKTKYLLSALVFGAAFVACNNEDFMADEQMNANNEIVGANLLSKGATLNIGETEGTDSRATVSGWEVGKDVAGLGWVVVGNPGDAQSGKELTGVSPILYNNHFFQYTEEGWNTKSNIYEGWHFAYFPYAHQTKPGKLSFEVNGKEFKGEDNRVDARNNAPYLSGAIFLSADNVDTSNGTIEESFNIKRVVNAVYPTLNIDEEFTGNDTLNTLPITSVTVKTNKNKFYPTIEVNPAMLPVGDIESVNSLYAWGALKGSNVQKSITTTLAEDQFLLNKNHQVRFFVAPVRNTWNAMRELSFRVDVVGGHFDIAYEDSIKDGKKVELTEIQKMNNEAIVKMNGLINSEGWKLNDSTVYSFWDNKVYDTQRFGLELGLGLENFTADYLIENIDQWNYCVALADALKEEAPVFTLTDKANVIFTDSIINAPKNGVTVQCIENGRGTLTISGIAKWNDNIKFNISTNIFVTVAKDAELTVEGELKPSWLYNNGTILAGELSTIGNNQRFTNNSRVIVEYGAYVYPKDGAEGVIAYEVPEEYDIKKINQLINGGTIGAANVNTLIVEEGVTLNCYTTTTTPATPSVSDRYDTTAGTGASTSEEDLNLTNAVNLEINGGIVSSTIAKTAGKVTITEGGELNGVNVDGEYLKITEGTVKCTSIKAAVTATDAEITAETIEGAVTAANSEIIAETITGAVVAENTDITAETITGNVTLKGTSSITNATITGDVTVETGTATLTNVTINGTLTIKAGASVVLNSAEYIYITEIVNNGTLTANNDIFVTNITLNPKSTTTLTDKDVAEKDWNKIIYYTDNYVNDKMTLNGTVLKYTLASYDDTKSSAENGIVLTSVLEDAKEGDVVYIPEGEYQFSKGSQINLTDVSIIAEEGTIIKSPINDTSNKVLYIYATGKEDILIKNITVIAEQTKHDIYVKYEQAIPGEHNVVFENVNCKKAIVDNGYVDGVDVNVNIINCKIDKFTVDGWNPNPVDGGVNRTNVTYDATSVIDFIKGGNAPANVTVAKK